MTSRIRTGSTSSSGISSAISISSATPAAWAEDLKAPTASVATVRSGVVSRTFVPGAADAALAGATPYLRMFGQAAGGCMLAEQALVALRESGDAPSRTALARYFAENIAVQASGLERSVTEGADSINNAQAALTDV